VRFQNIFLPVHLVKKVIRKVFVIEFHDDWFLFSVFSIELFKGKFSDAISIDRALFFCLFFLVRRNGVPFPPSSSSSFKVVKKEIINFPNVKRVSLRVLDVPDEKKETQSRENRERFFSSSSPPRLFLAFFVFVVVV